MFIEKVIGVGKVGDLLILERGSLEVVQVLAAGVPMVLDGALVRDERFLDHSNRSIRLEGRKDRDDG